MSIKNYFWAFPLFACAWIFNSCKTQIGSLNEDVYTLAKLDSTLIDQSNEFSLSLLSNVNKKLKSDDNSFLSPLGVQNVLALTSMGAKGETKEQLKKMIHLSAYSDEEIQQYFQYIMHTLNVSSSNESDGSQNSNSKIKFANSIWHARNAKIVPNFKESAQKSFFAEISEFKTSSPESVKTINNWVSNQTEGAIDNIIDEVPEDLMMLLVNALYFKGAWADSFDKGQTFTSDFKKQEQEIIQVEMMQRTGMYKWIKENKFEALQIPYSDSTFNAWFVKASKGTSLGKDFSMQDFKNLKNQARNSRILIQVPKLKFSFSKSVLEDLKALGGDLPFSNQADFGNLIQDMSLKIGDVKHKTFVELNEEGTEAAAVTSVGVVVTSMPANPSEFILDEPYLLIIEDAKSGLILFIGQINNPNSGFISLD